jgi:hypothetical protein
MNKYLAIVDLNGNSVRTLVLADNTLHAILKIEYKLGIGSIKVNPVKFDADDGDYMLLDEVMKSYKPLTPQQARISSLQIQKDNASRQLKAERARQKIIKAQQQISTASQSITPK